MVEENQISPAVAPGSVLLPGQTSPPYRILVVEDEPLIHQLYTEMLIDAGYEVDAAEDGAVAWDALQVNGYDLLITDNDMPNMTGIELLKQLYAARRTMPVIMATGTRPQEDFARYPWLQPELTILKPYLMVEFLGAVAEILSRTDSIPEQLGPTPIWQIRRPADRMWLR